MELGVSTPPSISWFARSIASEYCGPLKVSTCIGACTPYGAPLIACTFSPLSLVVSEAVWEAFATASTESGITVKDAITTIARPTTTVGNLKPQPRLILRECLIWIALLCEGKVLEL
jgi:hypothetical protein